VVYPIIALTWFSQSSMVLSDGSFLALTNVKEECTSIVTSTRIMGAKSALCLFLARQPPSGPGPPHSRGFYITHNDAPQSVGLLWTSDQPGAETST